MNKILQICASVMLVLYRESTELYSVCVSLLHLLCFCCQPLSTFAHTKVGYAKHKKVSYRELIAACAAYLHPSSARLPHGNEAMNGSMSTGSGSTHARQLWTPTPAPVSISKPGTLLLFL